MDIECLKIVFIIKNIGEGYMPKKFQFERGCQMTHE